MFYISFSGTFGQITQYWGEKVLRSKLNLGGPNSVINTARLEIHPDLKSETEKSYGETLDFEALPDKRSCRIAIYRPGLIPTEENWPQRIQWFLES